MCRIHEKNGHNGNEKRVCYIMKKIKQEEKNEGEEREHYYYLGFRGINCKKFLVYAVQVPGN